MPVRMLRIVAFFNCCILLMSLMTWNEGRQSTATAAAAPPNVLLIVTDDQRWDTMDYMPRTKARIFDEGATFTNAFATTPVCCPSRASIFTGMYASNHGIHLNQDPLTKPNFFRTAQANNYYTGLVGTKFLNSWDDTVPRSEFDYWAVGGGYRDGVTINVDGENVPQTDYVTYSYRDYASRFLEQAAAQPKPFMLMLAPSAPHLPAIPAPGDETLYPDIAPHRPPSFNESDVSDKPQVMQSKPLMTAQDIQTQDDIRLRQLQSLNAVDIAVDDLLTLLEDQGQLDNTMVIYTSDNGYLWGEHRLTAKSVPYEESIRVPLGIRYPALIPSPVVYDQLVGNIDIAPTMLDIANLPIPTSMDGRSLLGIFDGSATWRDDILLEGWLSPFNAVHTGQYVLIERRVGEYELYDLQIDPFQLQNVAGQPAYASIQSDLLARLDRLKPERHFTPTIYDNTSILIRYGGWRLIPNDFATVEEYYTSSLATDTVMYRTAATTSVAIVTYRGPDQGIARVKIDGVDQGLVDLYAPTPQYQYWLTYDNLPLAAHTVVFSPTGTQNPAARAARIRFDAFAIEGQMIENHSERISYSGWIGLTRAADYMGTHRESGRAGSSVTFAATLRTLTIYTATGPTYGIVGIYIDNVLWGEVDLYAATYKFQRKIYIQGLTPTIIKPDRIEVRVTGRKNSLSRGTVVVLDGYSVQ